MSFLVAFATTALIAIAIGVVFCCLALERIASALERRP